MIHISSDVRTAIPSGDILAAHFTAVDAVNPGLCPAQSRSYLTSTHLAVSPVSTLCSSRLKWPGRRPSSGKQLSVLFSPFILSVVSLVSVVCAFTSIGPQTCLCILLWRECLVAYFLCRSGPIRVRDASPYPNPVAIMPRYIAVPLITGLVWSQPYLRRYR